MSTVTHLLSRPRPPAGIVSPENFGVPDVTLPAPEVRDWIHQAYLAEDGPLYWEGHSHLGSASIGVLWTTAAAKRGGRIILGQAEMPERSLGRQGPWQRARAFQQLEEWFIRVPDFLITLDAFHADTCSDAEFCALLDHELCHCAQALDEYGMPKFNRDTGLPVYTLRGHDVEEFVSVVERFGIEAAGESAVDFVVAAAKKPSVAPVKLSQACGTCARMAAA